MMPMQVCVRVVACATLMGRHPGRERGRWRVRGLELSQRYPYMRAREACLADGDGRGVFTGGNGRRDALFQRDKMRIAEPQQHLLERIVARGVEWPAVAHAVARRMRGIDVGAGYKARGDRLGCGMAAAVTQKIGQHMSV